MRKSILALSILLAVLVGACAQTNCIWIERSEDGTMTQKLGVSEKIVKLLAHPGSSCNLDDMEFSYDTLAAVCNGDLVIRSKDSEGETKIYAGRFREGMKEETAGHDHLIIETTDGTGETSVKKINVESIEAVPLLIAMIGSNDSEAVMDKIESALERGGVLYVRDFRKNTRLWIYVN